MFKHLIFLLFIKSCNPFPNKIDSDLSKWALRIYVRIRSRGVIDFSDVDRADQKFTLGVKHLSRFGV